MPEAVIVATARSPIGRAWKGRFATPLYEGKEAEVADGLTFLEESMVVTR